MTQVLLGRDIVVTVIVTDVTGDPVTGLDFDDAVLFYRKAGGAATEKTLDAENFSEVDATNLPGLYEVSFTADETDTEGEFVAVLRQDGATDFENVTLRLEVTEVDDVDFTPFLRRLLADDRTTSSITQGESYIFPLLLTSNGNPVFGAVPADLEVTVVSTTSETVNAPSALEAVSSVPGLYRMTLDGALFNDLGEVFIRVAGLPPTSVTQFSGVMSPTMAVHAQDEETFYVAYDLSSGKSLQVSTDRGQTFDDAPDFPSDPGNGTQAIDGIQDGEDYYLYILSADTREFQRAWRLHRFDGDTWSTETVSEGTGIQFSTAWDVHAYAVDQVWLAGRYGANFQDNDGRLSFYDGDTIETIETFNDPVLAVHQNTETNLWVCIGLGEVRRGTLDGGTWTFTSPTVFADQWQVACWDVDFSGPDFGVMLFSLSNVYFTTDGGDNWDELSLPSDPTGDPRKVTVLDEGVVFLSYPDDGVYLTTDTGASWSKVAEAPFATFDADFHSVETGILGEESGGDSAFVFTPMADAIDTKNIQVQVVESAGAVDLTPVTESLDEIKGAGFLTGEHSLVEVKGAVDAVDVDLTPVLNSLDDIKGAGFLTAEHSLVVIKNSITAGGVDLSPVLDALDEIKGATFDENTDALDTLRAAVDDVSGSIDFSTIEAALDEIKGAGFDEGTDSLEVLAAVLESLNTEMDEVKSMVARTLGLSQENVRITDQNYDLNNNLVGSTITLYENAADVEAEVNPIATYILTASYNSDNRLVDYRIVRDTP